MINLNHFSKHLLILAFHATILSSCVSCSSNEYVKPRNNTFDNSQELSQKIKNEIAAHGVMLWLSMGFFAPVGTLIIRMSLREEDSRKKLIFFYFHLVFQVLSVLLGTAGAIMSLKSFENSFDNNHQRIGLILYGAIWIQAITGSLRPRRGNKRRRIWYFVHWTVGSTITLIGIIDIYTGLIAYEKKVSRSSRIWRILFIAQVSFMGVCFLLQDKLDYIQKQGVILGQHETMSSSSTNNNNTYVSRRENQKVLYPQSRGERIALTNLFHI